MSIIKAARAGRPTMADVAAAAGVSVPTVSKVINRRGDVSAATRTRVLEAMNDTGYRMRPFASMDRSGIIDILIDGVRSPWAMEVLDGAEHAAARHGYTLAITSTLTGSFNVKDWVDSVLSRRSDGVVFVLSRTNSGELDALAELHSAVVLLDPVGESDPRLSTVGATNWSGGVTATEHLLSLGHRRIGFIGGPPALQCSRDRYEGYAAALRRYGIEPQPELVTDGNFLEGSGRTGAARFFDLPERPTAIFAASDLQAAGVYEEARRRGLSIPEDLSVVGFDDTVICNYLWPALTTVRQPLADMAREAIRLVIDARTDPDRAGQQRLELSTTLIERGSTAPPA